MFVCDLTGQPLEVDTLDADWLLALAADTETKEREATRAKLRLAHQWCVLHPATAETGAATWADSYLPEALNCDETIGGDGAPDVAAFTAEAFAAAMQISTQAGMQLMADSLNLTHRLPRIWTKVETLQVPAWRARRVAQATASLTRQAAAYVDRQLADKIGTCGATLIDRAIAEAVARFDPAAQAEREQKARRNWGVHLSHGRALGGYDGTSWLDAAGDTADLTRFHNLVCATAAQLKTDGDTDTLEIRKAKALGVIADQALGTTGPAGADSVKTRLYLRLTLADLDDENAVGTVEKLGPATIAKIRDWVGHSRVTIQPVLDLNPDPAAAAVDRHDPPEWMREVVILRDPHCVFPWCMRDSRDCDLDHIEPYRHPDNGGPPGQTHPGNLSPLCRRHHRCKTTRRWRYERNPDGTYEWRSPHNRTYAVTSAGTAPATLNP